MTTMSLNDRLRAGEVTLVFDAANLSTKKLFELVKRAGLRGANIKRLIPATAHWEKVLHLRQNKGPLYRGDDVRLALQDAGVEIVPLDADAVDVATARLCEVFPTAAHGQEAKKKRLGLARAGRVSATIDWVTASMCPAGTVVVTDDKGVEFHGCETVSSTELAEALVEFGTDPG